MAVSFAETRNAGGGNVVGEGLQVNFGYTAFVISHGDVKMYIQMQEGHKSRRRG